MRFTVTPFSANHGNNLSKNSKWLTNAPISDNFMCLMLAFIRLQLLLFIEHQDQHTLSTVHMQIFYYFKRVSGLALTNHFKITLAYANENDKVVVVYFHRWLHQKGNRFEADLLEQDWPGFKPRISGFTTNRSTITPHKAHNVRMFESLNVCVGCRPQRFLLKVFSKCLFKGCNFNVCWSS